MRINILKENLLIYLNSTNAIVRDKLGFFNWLLGFKT